MNEWVTTDKVFFLRALWVEWKKSRQTSRTRRKISKTNRIKESQSQNARTHTHSSLQLTGRRRWSSLMMMIVDTTVTANWCCCVIGKRREEIFFSSFSTALGLFFRLFLFHLFVCVYVCVCICLCEYLCNHKKIPGEQKKKKYVYLLYNFNYCWVSILHFSLTISLHIAKKKKLNRIRSFE